VTSVGIQPSSEPQRLFCLADSRIAESLHYKASENFYYTDHISIELIFEEIMSEIRLDTLQRRNRFLSQLITAISNFSIQYNFQSISIALIVMSSSVCTSTMNDCNEGEQAAWVTSTATAVVFVGAIIGQLTMGYAGDVIGRNAAMVLTLSLVAISAVISAAGSGSASSIYMTIIVARFFLGVGVGGIYPLSATKAAEDGGKGGGNVNIAAVSFAFFWQTPGAMGPWLLALLTAQNDTMSMSTDSKWRLLLGLGAVPAAMVVMLTLWQIRLKEEQLLLLMSHDDGGTSSSASHLLLATSHYSSQPAGGGGIKKVNLLEMLFQHGGLWRDLLVTGGSWFLYDIAYYGVNLFGGEILSEINASDDDNVSLNSNIAKLCGQELLGLSLGIPACLLAIFMLHRVSSRHLQIHGFLFIALCFVLMAVTFVPLRDSNPNLLFAVYCCLLFSLNYGPNVSTYLLPAQTYPIEIRSTMNGASAAMGKIGAFVGVYMFGPLAASTSYPTVMTVCAIFSFLGAALSYYAKIRPPAGNNHEVTDAIIVMEGDDDDDDDDDERK